MDPITININLNLPEKQAEWICSAIACLAQIIDQASRTAGTPFPPAAHAEPDVTTIQHSDALVVRPGDTLIVGEDGKLHPMPKPDKEDPAAESAAKAQQNTENAAETQQDDADTTEKPAEPQHTHEELKNLVITATSNGKKEKTREIVSRYAQRVSQIPPEKIDEAYAALEKLLEVDDGTDA